MSILNWINVGQVSAERDPNLKSYFYDNGTTEKIIRNNQSFLILGRKGAGKTAVFSHLSTKPAKSFGKDDLIIPLSLAAYNWQVHFLLNDPAKSTNAAQRDSWRFVFCVEAINAIYKELQKTGDDVHHAIKKSNQILESLFSKPVPSWYDIVGDKLLNLAKLNTFSADFNLEQLKASVSGPAIALQELKADPTLKHKLNQNIENLTKYLEKQLLDFFSTNDKIRVFPLIDRLDESWVESEIKSCKEVITGLLNASELCLNVFSGRIRPIVFLREDIFNTLELTDRTKLKRDCGSLLMWDQESLFKMLKERLTFYAKQSSIAFDGDISSLFDRKLMRSRTSPNNYILHRTFYRPRDLIAYFGMVIELTREDEANKNVSAIPADNIYAAEAQFGDYLYEEFMDEWKTQLPEVEGYLSIFENLGKMVIPHEEMLSELVKFIGENSPTETNKILRFMYDNSIIGVKVGKSTQWKYRHTSPTHAFAFSDEYRVHPGLKSRLNLRDQYQALSIEGDEE